MRKVNKLLVGSLAATAILTGTVLAAEEPQLTLKTTQEYLEWSKLSSKEKKESLMPQTIAIEEADSILNNYQVIVPKVSDNLLRKCITNLDPASATISSEKYTLKDVLNLRVEHQGITSECWAFSLIKSMETSKALAENKRDLDNYSERHMDYATSYTFKDGTNPIGFKREVGDGGILQQGLAYLVNGTGAVLESDMPFENNEYRINLNSIDKKVDTIVTGWKGFARVEKSYEYDSNGNTSRVHCFDASGNEYSESEMRAFRNDIKNHLVSYGAISSYSASNQKAYYDGSSPLSSYNFNMNSTEPKRDHAVTIVGWDDTYSRDNFKEGHKPSRDGAYIVLNSYGAGSHDKGYYYISYEDYFIEQECYGITGTAKKDYDKLYQNDFYSGIFEIGTPTKATGYYGTSFKRNSSDKEKLDAVGIQISSRADIEIYVNTSSSKMDLSAMNKVATISNLEAGYHRVEFAPIELTGSEFSVVVKQTSKNGTFYFEVESAMADTAFANVKSSGRSYYSLSGTSWSKLNDMNIAGVNMNTADVCIKAFTDNVVEKPAEEPKDEPTDKPTDKPAEEPTDKPTDKPVEEPKDEPTDKPTDKPAEEPKDEPTDKPADKPVEEPKDEPTDKPTDKPTEEPKEEQENPKAEYKILDNYVMNVKHDTKVSVFKNNFGKTSEVTYKDGIVGESDYIKSGMKVKINGKEYIIVVRGDTNLDGKLTLTDLSKLILHYNEFKNFTLTGTAEKAADLNIDGKVNLVDVSQMIVLYNSL